VAVETAKDFPKVMFQNELMNVTEHMSPQLLGLLDRVAMRAVQETVEETALKNIIPATQKLANQVIQTGAQRELFDQAMRAVASVTHQKALVAAKSTALDTARELTDPEAFDMLSYAGLGSRASTGLGAAGMRPADEAPVGIR
jgi:hypothetical protein